MALTPQQRAEVTRRVQRLAWLLDARFAIPFTQFRFGLDALIGLVPVLGDFTMAVLALYIVFQARRLGTPWGKIFIMLLLVAADWIIGSVPVLGDIADAVFKINLINMRLMGISPPIPQRPGTYQPPPAGPVLPRQ